MKNKLIYPLILAVSICLWTTVCDAQLTPAQEVVVQQMLDKHWATGLENRRASESIWEKYTAKTDALVPAVQWAYVLNRIEHDKYRQARAQIDQIVKSNPLHWQARYAQIWLKLAVGEVDSALLDMEQMRTNTDAATLDDAVRGKIFSQLGRLYGFAEGPARQKASTSQLDETLEKVVTGLNDQDFNHFDDFRKQVTQKFESLESEKTTNIADQVKKREQQNKIRTVQIADENNQMADRQNELGADIGKLRDELNQETSQLRSRARPIESDLRRIRSDIRSSESRARQLSSDIVWLEHDALHEPDPYRQDYLLRRAANIRRSLFTEQSRLNGLAGQYDGALTQLDIIQGQLASVEQLLGGQINNLQSESRQLNAQRKRNQRELKKLQNPKPEKGYVRSMNSKTGHLPTYDEFPTAAFRRDAIR